MLPYGVPQTGQSQKVWLYLGLSDHHRWPLCTPIRNSDCARCACASWKSSTHHPCQVFTLSTVDMRYQSPQCDYLHFHLYQHCVTLHSLHPNGPGEFSHILSSCQMCLRVPESCLGDQLSTRPGAPSSPACPRGKQLVLLNRRQGRDVVGMLCPWGKTPRRRGKDSPRSTSPEEGTCCKNTFWLTSGKSFPVVKGQQSASASHKETSGKKSFLKASSHYIACLGPLAPQREHKAREDMQAGQPSPP